MLSHSQELSKHGRAYGQIQRGLRFHMSRIEMAEMKVSITNRMWFQSATKSGLLHWNFPASCSPSTQWRIDCPSLQSKRILSASMPLKEVIENAVNPINNLCQIRYGAVALPFLLSIVTLFTTFGSKWHPSYHCRTSSISTQLHSHWIGHPDCKGWRMTDPVSNERRVIRFTVRWLTSQTCTILQDFM